jgi:hypothetical protein
MSRRPGIGSDWFARYGGDVFPSDEVVVRGGVKCKPPKFYDKLMEAYDPDMFRDVKSQRILSSREDASYDMVVAECLSGDRSGARLTVRGDVKESISTLLKRGYENA